MDLKLFEKLSEGDRNPRFTEALARDVKADPVLLGRIMKHLGSMGVVQEFDCDCYGPTRFSDALTVPSYRDGIPVGLDTIVPTLSGLRQLLSENSYQNPHDPGQTAFQLGLKTDKPYFEWLQEHPENRSHFNNFMAGKALSRARWMDPGSVPVNEMLIEGTSTDNDTVFMVDIGGGYGQDIEMFKKQYPDVPGRLILQDMNTTIEGCRDKLAAQGIEAMAHDFFTPQPIRGARAYYLHSVLHDWPDPLCRQILLNIISAMKPGYSKILINDHVIPEKGAYYETTALDIVMMNLFSAGERREKSWNELLNSIGLKVVKIWEYEKGNDSLIEAELA